MEKLSSYICFLTLVVMVTDPVVAQRPPGVTLIRELMKKSDSFLDEFNAMVDSEAADAPEDPLSTALSQIDKSERVLKLDRKGISVIPAYSFHGYTTAYTLLLQHNEITDVSVFGFIGLDNLRVLVLEYNKISALKRGMFKGISQLTTLNLRGNQISTIDPAAFDDVTALVDLDLRKNDLTKISADLFKKLVHLKELRLADNQITFVDPSAFLPLVNLKELDLYGNPCYDVTESCKALSKRDSLLKLLVRALEEKRMAKRAIQ